MKALGIPGLQKLVEQIKDAYEEKYPVPTPPIVAIGGINIHNVDQVIEGTPVNGIAVISAIVASEDPYFASRSLRTVIDKSVGEKETKAIHSHRSVEKLTEDILHLFQKIREKKPLIHHITNYVVMNQTANATLHLGGSPVMSHAIEEVEEMVSLCNALVINPGTLSAPWIRAMSLAGLRANSLGIPIIFDPVGAGATSFRTRTYQIFLKELDVNIIKGNSAEIGSVYGDMSVETRGVDSAVGVENPERVVQSMSTRYNGAIVAVTGRTDYASDGVNCIAVENNSDMLAGLTGTGCTVSALIACFAGVTKEDYLAATVGGLAVMGVCAELAEKDISVKGPASFNVALYDRIATLTPEQLRANMKLKNIQVAK
jgi:hydroxyethylthiazole kinase